MGSKLPDLSSYGIKTGHLFLGGAIVMAIISALMFKSVSGGNKHADPNAGKQAVKTAEVMVAVNFMPPGSNILRTDVKRVAWPVDYLPEGQYYAEPSDILDRTVTAAIFPGQPIYKAALAGENSKGGLPVLIPKGMRAVTVAVTEIKGVAGFVKPGDHVDVLTTLSQKLPGQNNGDEIKINKTILQNIQVLASAQEMVDESANPDIETPRGLDKKALSSNDATGGAAPAKPEDEKQPSEQELEKKRKEAEKARREDEKRAKMVSSVTLAVTPEQAQVLSLAEDNGELRLVLRPEGDTSTAELGGTSNQDLLAITGLNTLLGQWPLGPVAPGLPGDGKPAADLPAAPVHTGPSVELINGDEKTNVQF